MSTHGQRSNSPRPIAEPAASIALNDDVDVEGKGVANLSSTPVTHPTPGPITSDSDEARDHSQVLEVQFKGLRSEFFTFSSVSSCLLYTSPSPRDGLLSRMPSSA